MYGGVIAPAVILSNPSVSITGLKLNWFFNIFIICTKAPAKFTTKCRGRIVSDPWRREFIPDAFVHLTKIIKTISPNENSGSFITSTKTPTRRVGVRDGYYPSPTNSANHNTISPTGVIHDKDLFYVFVRVVVNHPTL